MPPAACDDDAAAAAAFASARGDRVAARADEVSTLHVTNLPMDCTERELYLLFATFPGWEGGHLIHYSGVKQPMSFVCFATRGHAAAALQKTHGIPWAGGEGKSSRIRCAFAAQQSRSNRRDRRFTSANVAVAGGAAAAPPSPAHPAAPAAPQHDDDGGSAGAGAVVAASPRRAPGAAVRRYPRDFLCALRDGKYPAPAGVRGSAVYVPRKRAQQIAHQQQQQQQQHYLTAQHARAPAGTGAGGGGAHSAGAWCPAAAPVHAAVAGGRADPCAGFAAACLPPQLVVPSAVPLAAGCAADEAYCEVGAEFFVADGGDESAWRPSPPVRANHVPLFQRVRVERS